MPCGGIYPVQGTWHETMGIKPSPTKSTDKVSPTDGGCWMCHMGGCEHFCDEWDTYIHARCVARFLLTDEGHIVMEHGHTVILDFSKEQ